MHFFFLNLLGGFLEWLNKRQIVISKKHCLLTITHLYHSHKKPTNFYSSILTSTPGCCLQKKVQLIFIPGSKDPWCLLTWALIGSIGNLTPVWTCRFTPLFHCNSVTEHLYWRKLSWRKYWLRSSGTSVTFCHVSHKFICLHSSSLNIIQLALSLKWDWHERCKIKTYRTLWAMFSCFLTPLLHHTGQTKKMNKQKNKLKGELMCWQ